jgi:hypothetical protein
MIVRLLSQHRPERRTIHDRVSIMVSGEKSLEIDGKVAPQNDRYNWKDENSQGLPPRRRFPYSCSPALTRPFRSGYH